MQNSKMFQISTVQALALGYSKSVITVDELLKHGNIGLGTYEDVDGEMIVVDGNCYQAHEDGSVSKAPLDKGVPFCAISHFQSNNSFNVSEIESINDLKKLLDLKIDEDFALNSMHIVRIDGEFKMLSARSEAPYKSHHIELKTILERTQKDFVFNNIRGTLVCVYFPDFMDGINVPGWHLHFISENRTQGGHVFELSLTSGTAKMCKINSIEIKLPSEAAFDTYALKGASGSDIKKVEQGK